MFKDYCRLLDTFHFGKMQGKFHSTNSSGEKEYEKQESNIEDIEKDVGNGRSQELTVENENVKIIYRNTDE